MVIQINAWNNRLNENNCYIIASIEEDASSQLASGYLEFTYVLTSAGAVKRAVT